MEHLDRIEARLTQAEVAEDIYFHREVMFYSREGRKMEVVTISSRDGITEEQEEQVSCFLCALLILISLRNPKGCMPRAKGRGP